MSKRLSTWDNYVKNSSRDPLELPIKGKIYKIHYPTKKRAKALQDAQIEGDTDAMVLALLGDETGKVVLELAEDQPVNVLDKLINDVLKEFGFGSFLEEEEAELDAEEDQGKSGDESEEE